MRILPYLYLADAIPFFEPFNFDTLLALISCIAGIVALFVGGKAYKNYKTLNNSFNDTKNYSGTITDNSQRAAGNIYNQTCDATSLVTLTSQNFEASLEKAYSCFEKKCADNLHQIIDETNKIIHESKISIGGYTKIDWINIYFESAKNSSDEYMQQIWAKVLAKELERPGSFSYKTLDVLKNLSADGFRQFELLASLQVNGLLLKSDLTDQHISWEQLLRLQEHGLINLASTTKTHNINGESKLSIAIDDGRYLLDFVNQAKTPQEIQYQIYVLTSSGTELCTLLPIQQREEYIVDFAKEIRKKCKNDVSLSLYRINYITGNTANYNETDLLQ